jgi:hypothetical protein
VGSNPTQGMDVYCLCMCVFFCVCVQVEALRRADHPSNESYRLSLNKKLRKFSPILQKGEQAPKCGSNEEEKNAHVFRNANTIQRGYKEIIRVRCPCAQLIKHYAMKAYGGVDVYIHIFLTSALVGGEWSASRPGRFTTEKKLLGTHRKVGWVGPRAGLGDMEK